mgnify:CR=1 FL=1
MDKTDVLTGRIVQRVIDERMKSYFGVSIVHGVDNFCDIDKLINNLFAYFPDCLITLKKLKFGYELRIDVDIVSPEVNR